MSDLEKELRRLPTLGAPDHVWKRIRGRTLPRRRYLKEGMMLAAAVGLLAWLATTLTWSPGSPTLAKLDPQEADAWVDLEPAEADLSPQDRIVVEALISDLGSTRRESAERLLESRLDAAIPLLKKAARSENPDVRASVEALIRRWEDARRRVPLKSLLSDARKEAKLKEEWKAIAQRAVAGEPEAVGEIRKIGWQAAPVLADAATKGSPADQLHARVLLRELLLALYHRGHSAVTLVRRKKNVQEYGLSAFSFRHATQDAEAVRNEIDVIYNNCGLLHFTPYGGTQCIIADAGKMTLDQVTELPKQGWRPVNALIPVEGHVYVLEIRDENATYTYKFEVKNLRTEAVDLEWAGIGVPRKAPAISPLKGKTGVFGACGGRHGEY